MSNSVLTQNNSNVKEVRLVDGNGSRVIPFKEALYMAQEVDLDLVVISNGDIPVCKILNYSKYLYEKSKKEKEISKNQKTTPMKEVQLSPYINKHDVEIKAKQTLKFLEKGHQVKISLLIKGRDKKYSSNANSVIQDFLNSVGDDNYSVDKTIKQEDEITGVIIVKRK